MTKNNNKGRTMEYHQIPITEQIKKRKLKWFGHTLRKPQGTTERTTFDRNTQGSRRTG
jgi:hypothetical protein